MKTLANAKDKAEIVQRLGAIGPASRRRWGKMTVAEMICHLNEAFRVAMGEKAALPISNLFTRSVMKWVALQLPFQWPHGVSTVPECEAGGGVLRHQKSSDTERAAGAAGEIFEAAVEA